jgi:sigma-B regulation protein RsbU (phosphoserine phosphatase)
MSKKSKTRHSLSRRITSLIAILMVVMFLAVSFISYRALRSTYLRLYGEKAQDIVRFLASEIDGDRLYHYVETGETDSYYDWLSQEFTRFKSQFSGIAFLYLFYPEEEQFIYILEAIRPGDDPEKISSMGDSFEYGEMELAHLVPDIKAGRASSELIMGADVGYGETVSAWAPVFDSDGKVAAMVEADCSLANLSAVIREYALRIIGVQLLFMLLVLLLVIEILQRNVTRPVGQLSKMVESYEHGSVTQPKFRHEDELQMLGNSFAEMTERINAYTQEVARATEEQGRISAEYNVAKQIQTDILPSVFPAFPERRDFDIYASLYSSKEICGDFYDFFLIDEDHLCMVVGDVSGKGVPAAMFMVIVKTLIKNRALQGFSPAEVLQNVSEQVLEGNNAGMFTTVWLAVLELSTGKGLAANAGQEHPALRHAGKRFELQEYRHSPPVGAMEGVRFRDHGFQLEPGDTLFVYTDGVKASKNPKEEPFGKERILEALNREPGATPSVLLQTMKSAIDSFYGEAQQTDDLTMLSLKYYGTGQPSDEWK